MVWDDTLHIGRPVYMYRAWNGEGGRGGRDVLGGVIT